jgi:hypothetical protein
MIKKVTEIQETTIYIGDKLVVVKEEVHTIKVTSETPGDLEHLLR